MTSFPADFDEERHGVFQVGGLAPGAGNYTRPERLFRNRIAADDPEGFAPEPGRYHLYLGWGGPWAHAAAIAHRLRGLQDSVSTSYVDDFRDARGWAFRERHGPDTANGFVFLGEAYERSAPGYEGAYTVPLIWDRKTGRIVNDNALEVAEDLAKWSGPRREDGLELYPQERAAEIDALNARLYGELSNAVYRIGAARVQEDYERLVKGVFALLDELEQRLAGQRYLLGDRITLPDVRFWVTLARFDIVYNRLFRVSLRRIVDYPNIWAYARELFGIEAFAATTNFEWIVDGYYNRAWGHLNFGTLRPVYDASIWREPVSRG